MSGLKFTLQVLKDYGYDVPQVGRNICCLFHEEDRPSARVFENGAYHCWSAKCGVHFSDGLGALMQVEECSFPEAIKIAQSKYGLKVEDKDYVDMKDLHSLEESIVKQVISKRPELFLSVYKTLDDLIEAKDLEKMKTLYSKLSSGEIK